MIVPCDSHNKELEFGFWRKISHLRLCLYFTLLFHSIANPFVYTNQFFGSIAVVCFFFLFSVASLFWVGWVSSVRWAGGRLSISEHFMHPSNDNDLKITRKELKNDISKSFWIHKVPTLNTGGKFCGGIEWEKGLTFCGITFEQITPPKWNTAHWRMRRKNAHQTKPKQTIKCLLIRSENLNVASYALSHKLAGFTAFAIVFANEVHRLEIAHLTNWQILSNPSHHAFGLRHFCLGLLKSRNENRWILLLIVHVLSLLREILKWQGVEHTNVANRTEIKIYILHTHVLTSI